jgi:hypothetical protein
MRHYNVMKNERSSLVRAPTAFQILTFDELLVHHGATLPQWHGHRRNENYRWADMRCWLAITKTKQVLEQGGEAGLVLLLTGISADAFSPLKVAANYALYIADMVIVRYRVCYHGHGLSQIHGNSKPTIIIEKFMSPKTWLA